MCRSHSWLLMSWCLTSGLNLFTSAAPPPPFSTLGGVNDIRSLAAERNFWLERCARNGLNQDSSIGSKSRPLEAICDYIRRKRLPPVMSSDEETSIDRILLRKRKEDSSEYERSQSKKEGYIVGKFSKKDRFLEALGKERPQSKAWGGKAGYDQVERSPIPTVRVPIGVDDSVGKLSDGSWEYSSDDQDSSSELERVLDESKRSDGRMMHEKSVHGGQGTNRPRWSVYFIG